MTEQKPAGSLPVALGRLVSQAVNEEFGVDLPLYQAIVSIPPNPEFGDLSSAISLRLAKELKTNPRAIADRLARRLSDQIPAAVSRITVTPPGYVNFFLDSAVAVDAMLASQYRLPLVTRLGEVTLDPSDKILIEHTNINPNKAAHIGHLRNACLGDSLARMLRRSGFEVEVQNYIDDTGTAVADIVVGLETLDTHHDPEQRFDDYCWDLYTRVHERYEKDSSYSEHRRRVLTAIEHGDNDTARTARDVAARIVRYHLDTMADVNVDYDLLTWESHILGLKFWDHCLSMLKTSGGLTHETAGANQGCWIVPLADHPAFASLESPDKVLVRSDGTATYTAKDIAYQLWKFGLLGLDFNYNRYAPQWSGRPLWTTAIQSSDDPPPFGRADVAINVIDVRQAYLQDILKACLDRLGFRQAADNSIHFAYEVVVLSDDAARELGMDGDTDTVTMSGRKGVGVKAHDLIRRVRHLARSEVISRHPGWDPSQVDHTASALAAAAIRYYMIRYRTSVILAFDFKDALSLTGKTGPYLQYAYARCSRILAKAGTDDRADISAEDITPSERRLVVLTALTIRRLEEAAEKLEVSALAEHAYDLASAFMAFYENSPVLAADIPVRNRRLRLVRLFREVLGTALDALGIPLLTEM